MKDEKCVFPDGMKIDDWFVGCDIPKLGNLGKQYVLTAYDIFDDGRIHTQEIQSLIDRAAREGGGVIVVPEGTFLTGALFFKKGVHLYVAKGGILMGSDSIADYPVVQTRIEGETCQYFSALINADHADGFKLCGEGVIDGNGEKAWRAFWLRRAWNPDCTNKDEQRPRLVYISDSKDVTIAGLTLQNSHYWTNHIYRCSHVKFLNCTVFSPSEPINAPSTDAIDIDACTDVLIKGCYINVNDDGVVLKGGKGPWADENEDNGANERIIVEDCVFGHNCHGCLTCGSESIHNRNIIVRRVQLQDVMQFLWLKFRPDTPQCYEYIRIEEVVGSSRFCFLNINPWTQFFDLKGRTDKPVSIGRHIEICKCRLGCELFFNVSKNDEQYTLSDFSFRDIVVHTKESRFDPTMLENCRVCDVEIIEEP